jgi:hypothetical protein
MESMALYPHVGDISRDTKEKQWLDALALHHWKIAPNA